MNNCLVVKRPENNGLESKLNILQTVCHQFSTGDVATKKNCDEFQLFDTTKQSESSSRVYRQFIHFFHVYIKVYLLKYYPTIFLNQLYQFWIDFDSNKILLDKSI